MFGKPGRPPEDRVQRRREIWSVVAPLIEKYGARNLTMRQVAAACLMSVGGLYHYFPNKRALVLFGLDPAGYERTCADFYAAHGQLAQLEPDAAAAEFARRVAELMFFVRPAMQAALELGTADFLARLDVDQGLATAFGLLGTYDKTSVEAQNEMFFSAFTRMMPDSDDRDVRAVAKAVRRLDLVSLIDRSMTREELEHQLYGVVRGIPVGQRRTDLAIAG